MHKIEGTILVCCFTKISPFALYLTFVGSVVLQQERKGLSFDHCVERVEQPQGNQNIQAKRARPGENCEIIFFPGSRKQLGSKKFVYIM